MSHGFVHSQSDHRSTVLSGERWRDPSGKLVACWQTNERAQRATRAWSKNMDKYKDVLEALVCGCCDQCKRVRSLYPSDSAVACAFRLGQEQRVLRLFKNAFQAFHHADEGPDFGAWERDSKRYIVCAVDAAVYLETAGLAAPEVRACRKALFEQLFQVGAQKLSEQQAKSHQELPSVKAQLKELRCQINQDEARFRIACEAVFRGKMPAQEADKLRKQLVVNRQRLTKRENDYAGLVLHRDAIMALHAGFKEFTSIRSLEEFEEFLRLL